VLWGFIHGALHVIGKVIGRFRVVQITPVFIRRIIVFILIVFTWIFFRAESGADAFNYIGGIFSSGYAVPSMPVLMYALMIICYLYGWFREYRLLNFLEKPAVKSILFIIMLAWILIFASSDASDFIYFQF